MKSRVFVILLHVSAASLAAQTERPSRADRPEDQRQDPAPRQSRPVRIPEHELHSIQTTTDLVGSKAVARDLGIDPDQVKKLRDLASRTDYSNNYSTLWVNLKTTRSAWERSSKDPFDPEAIAARTAYAEAQVAFDKVLAARERAVRAELTPEQSRRLDQIRLRRDGVRSLFRPDVMAEIHLENFQIDQIRKLFAHREAVLEARQQRWTQWSNATGYDKEMFRIIRKSQAQQELTKQELNFVNGRNETSRAGRADINRFEQTIDDQLWRILTPAQRRRFERLLGEPFDIRYLTRDAPPLPPETPPSKPAEADPSK